MHALLSELAGLLEKVHLGNTIPECVLISEDGVCHVKAMDLTSSIYVETSAKIDLKEGSLGIGNLGLLIKYLQAYTGIDSEIVWNDNRLTIKPKGGATLKFLLADPDLIPTYEADWEEEKRIETLKEEFNGSLVLTKEATAEFSSLSRMFATKTAVFTVNKKGDVFVSSGTETEHQINVPFGKSSMSPCTVEINSKNLLSVFALLEFEKNPEIFLGKDQAALISCDSTHWVLLQIDKSEPEEAVAE